MKPHDANLDDGLSRFRLALGELYGERLERVVLFGFRARGDFDPESDDDVAVFIRDPGDWFENVVRLADLGATVLLDTGAVISAKPFPAEAYQGGSPLMREIQRDGFEL